MLSSSNSDIEESESNATLSSLEERIDDSKEQKSDKETKGTTADKNESNLSIKSSNERLNIGSCKPEKGLEEYYVLNKTNEVQAENGAVEEVVFSLEGPLQWRKTEDSYIFKQMPHYQLNVLMQKQDHNLKLNFISFVNKLILLSHIYEEDTQKALQYLSELQSMVTSCNKRDVVCYPLVDSMLYLIDSTKVYIHYDNGFIEDALDVMDHITSINEMDPSEKAGIFLFRGAIYGEYGYCGLEKGCEFLREAIKIYPENAQSYFVLGKSLGRMRKIQNYRKKPTEEEVESFECAFDLNDSDPYYTLELADVYRELAVYLTEHEKNVPDDQRNNYNKKTNELNNKSCNLFRSCLKINSRSPLLLFKCARGLLKLPQPFRDLRYAEILVHKGLNISPNNNFGNHIAATIESFKQNDDKAKEYLRRCKKNFGADMDYLKIMYRQNYPGEDIINRLTKLRNVYKEKNRVVEVDAQTVSFYLFVKFDLNKALTTIMKTMDVDAHSINLLNHVCLFFQKPSPISLYDILMDEIRLSINNNLDEERKQNNLDSATKQLYKSFIKKIKDNNIIVEESDSPGQLRKCFLENGRSVQQQNQFRNKNVISSRRNSFAVIPQNRQISNGCRKFGGSVSCLSRNSRNDFNCSPQSLSSHIGSVNNLHKFQSSSRRDYKDECTFTRSELSSSNHNLRHLSNKSGHYNSEKNYPSREGNSDYKSIMSKAQELLSNGRIEDVILQLELLKAREVSDSEKLNLSEKKSKTIKYQQNKETASGKWKDNLQYSSFSRHDFDDNRSEKSSSSKKSLGNNFQNASRSKHNFDDNQSEQSSSRKYLGNNFQYGSYSKHNFDDNQSEKSNSSGKSLRNNFQSASEAKHYFEDSEGEKSRLPRRTKSFGGGDYDCEHPNTKSRSKINSRENSAFDFRNFNNYNQLHSSKQHGNSPTDSSSTSPCNSSNNDFTLKKYLRDHENTFHSNYQRCDTNNQEMHLGGRNRRPFRNTLPTLGNKTFSYDQNFVLPRHVTRNSRENRYP